MTDRLTDEQVAELWERAQQNAEYLRGRACWTDAKAEHGLGPDDLTTSAEVYESVLKRANELRAERGLLGAPCWPTGHVDWEDVIKLLAEVRRARGME